MLQVSDLAFLDWGPLSFSVDAGECLGLSGASGSGKSLLLRAIADIDPHRGRVSLDGVASTDVEGPEWRHRVGMLPAESRWWFDTVRPHFPDKTDRELFAKLGFADAEVLDWPVRRLSVGERQRLALARLLAHSPRALLLDEPTANLDAESVRLAEDLIGDYRTTHLAPVLWVAHDAGQLARVARRRLRMLDKELREAA